MSRTRDATPTAATVVETESTGSREGTQQQRLTGTLRLRGEAQARADVTEDSDNRRIRWAENVVDNEGLGKKSSKVCCIYHKPRAVDESSSESDSSDSSSSESDSDNEVDNGDARMANRRAARSRPHGHAGHNHENSGGDGQNGHCCNHSNTKKKEKGARRKPNAYERVPHVSKKGK